MRRMYSEKQIKELARSEIQTGNLAIDGDLSVSGESVFNDDVAINGNLTGNSIIENMSGYSFEEAEPLTNVTLEYIYAGAVKNGNKLTLVLAMNVTRTGAVSGTQKLASFVLPTDISDKIYPVTIGGYDYVDVRQILLAQSGWYGRQSYVRVEKDAPRLNFMLNDSDVLALTQDVKYYLRYEVTILLSDNMAE